MSASIRARLHAAAAKYTNLCALSRQDVQDAIATIDELQDCLADLTAHIAQTGPKNERGNDLRLSFTYLRAVTVLERLSADGKATNRTGNQ